MRAECIEAVSKAIGRSITQAEAQAIESRIITAKKAVARQDRAAWQQMTGRERLNAAAQIAGQQLIGEAAKAKQRVALTILAHDRIENGYRDFTAQGDKPFRAVGKILERVYAKTKGVSNEYFSDLLNTIDAVKPRFLGMIEDAKQASDLVREIFHPGSSGNDVMRKAAQTWLDTIEAMRVRFNAAGGDIGKLDYGYLPQPHDAVRVLKAGQQKWIGDILPLLDRSRYIDENGSMMTDHEMSSVLSGIWETLSSNGINKIEPGTTAGKGMLANRHSDHRALHFKNASSYLQYAADYSKGSIFSAMQKHVSSLARDIAMAEEMGPNPARQFSWLYDTANRTGDADSMGLTKSMWKVLSGEANHPVDVKLAEVMQGARNLASHAKLGSALISSLNDFPTYFMTTGFNRIGFGDALMNLLHAFGGETTEYANRAGLVAESVVSDMNRWAEGNIGKGWTGKLANATMKASLLEAWTDAIRRGLSTVMMGAYGKLSRSDWASLHPHDRALIQAKGVSETDFNVWRLAKPEDWRGSQMLTKDAIRAIPDADLAAAGLSQLDRNRALSRLLGAILDESEYASLGQDLRARAITSGGLDKGTFTGELWRSMMLFKGFPIAMISRHWGRVSDQWRVGDKVSSVGYAAGLITALTIFGAITMQLKSLIAGKDPQNMNPANGEHGGKFWIAAAAQGGGLGFAGDLIFQAMGGGQSQGGSSTASNVLSTVMGPVVGSGADLLDVMLGKTDTAAGTVRWLRSNAPLAGFINLWYAKSVIDHAVLQDMQEYLSPGYLSRIQHRAQKDWNQSYYWRPGSGTPDRAPNFSKMAGD